MVRTTSQTLSRGGIRVKAPASCSLPPDSANAYMGREMPFRLTPPGTNTNSFLAIMLTAYTPDEALLLVDQGVRSDGSCPTQTVLLEKTTDTARNVRYLAFDNAIFDASGVGTVNVNENINVGTITFNTPGYTISSDYNTLNLLGAQSIVNNADAAISATIVISESGSMNKWGSGMLTLSGVISV